MTLALLISLLGPAIPPLPPLRREFRGAWIATVDDIDWPARRGESTALARAQLLRLIEAAARLRLNALVLQVRPSADALYPSKLEPWSEFLTGRQGRPPSPAWDPLAYAIAEAHKRGIQLHAWFNPFRATSPAQHGPNAPGHVSRTHPEAVKKYGKLLWLDPGEPFARDQALAVIRDVVRRYDVDGVHIDDYFYPYKDDATDPAHADFPDGPSWNRYRRAGGKLGRADWRRANVDGFVAGLYREVKRLKPWVLVGISPFGIARPGVPAGIRAGIDQFADLYADPRKWLRNGWCDYLSPQLYWPVRQTAQAYPVLLRWWIGQNVDRRHIWPGNFTSRVDPADGTWGPQEILDQIAATRRGSDAWTRFSGPTPLAAPERGASGNLHFSMRVFLRDPKGLDEALLAGPYRQAALPPASPWLARGAGPRLRLVLGRVVASRSVEFVAYARRDGGAWSGWRVVGAANPPKAGAPGSMLAEVGVDRYGRLSRAVFVR